MASDVRRENTDGGLVIGDAENADAWIRASYRDGWWRRKLWGAGDYAEMIHPYQLQCRLCRRFDDPMLWGAGSPYCPCCEQHMDYLPHKAAEGVR